MRRTKEAVDNAKQHLFHDDQGSDIPGIECHRAHDRNFRAPSSFGLRCKIPFPENPRILSGATMGRYQGVRFWILFVGLLAFLMLWPLADELTSRQVAPNIFRDILVLSCVLAVSNNARMAIIVLVLGLALVISRWLFEFGFGMGFVSVGHGLGFVILLIVAVSILTEVLRAREVTAHLVVGAVCVYLLLAMTWAFLYYAVEALAPGAILVRGQPFSGTGALPVADAEGIKMLYISMATITTLGNSDIAVTFLARQMATIEAITGQLYLAVLIARLVGFSSAAAPPLSGND